MKPSVHRAVARSLWSLISGLMLAMSAPTSADDVLRIMLEEPVAGEIHGGVGNLRGWAVATDGIDKIEIMIDGEYAFDAPYGGARGDVGGAFPEIANASQSGFSLAYAYSNLSPGSHTISAVAHTLEGKTQTSSATFETVRFKQSFISGAKAVDLWRRRKPDLILMDINMPVMGGIAAALRIREEAVERSEARVPIVALTANAMSHQVNDYLEAGLDAHVAKPVGRSELVRVIGSFLVAAQ